MAAESHTLKILIAGGGTGGHLFPGIAIAQAFAQDRPCEIRFVGTERGLEAKVVPREGFQIYHLSLSGLYRVGLLKKMLALAKLPWAFVQCALILWTFRPHLVLGVGGYASGPLLLMAWLLGFNTALQEQNASPGLTNRFLGKRLPLAFVPFAGLEGVFKNPVVVGNPVRQPILQAAKAEDQRPESPFVLSLIGGSQGARVLNQCMVEALPLLAASQKEFFILHQTGSQDLAQVQAAYQAYPQFQAKVQEFFSDMASLFAATHLFVGRAGSMVNELLAMGRAMLLVPIPQSSGDHQKSNALKIVEGGAGWMIEQKDLTPSLLAERILWVLEHQAERQAAEAAAKAMFGGDAAQKIKEELLRFYDLEKLG